MSAAGESTDVGVDPERVAQWLSQDADLQVIDVREPYEREAGHIAGTRHVPLVELSSQAATIDPRAPGRLLLPGRQSLADGRQGAARVGP